MPWSSWRCLPQKLHTQSAKHCLNQNAVCALAYLKKIVSVQRSRKYIAEKDQALIGEYRKINLGGSCHAINLLITSQ